VSDLFGGYGAWAAAGLPAVAGAAATAFIETPEVDAASGAALVETGTLLLDVREPDEWEAGHAPGAVLVPMGQVHDRAPTLPGGRVIVVICRSGGRSAAITEVLRGGGHDAVNLAGGMRAWAAAGLPVTTDTGTPGRVA
jgi:rhodanese-related sulfurtransferase